MDERVGREVLRVVQPTAIESAMQAAHDVARHHDEVLAALGRDLEAARYAAQRAQKQYDASDPDNRLVADELEHRWNQALQRVRDLELRLEQHRGSQGLSTAGTIEDFADLADDLEAIWNRPTSDARLKKRIVRTLIREVVADIDAEASEVVLVIHWQGGLHTELRVPRRRRGTAASTSPDVIAAVRVLARVSTDRMIAGLLNRNGLKTGRGNRWTQERITSLRTYHQIPNHCPETKEREGWMTLTEAAAFLGLSSRTVRLAVERGDLPGEHPLSDGPWVLRRDHLVSQRAQQLIQRIRSRIKHPAVPTSGQQSLSFSST